MARSDRAAFLSGKKKEAIRVQKRLNALYKIRHEAPLVPLDKPVRSGWKRFFAVRPDVRKSPQGHRIQHLLDALLQNIEYSSRKDFTRRDWKTKKYLPIEQNLRYILPKDYEALRPGEKTHFYLTFFVQKAMYGMPKTKKEVYVFLNDWQFIFRIKPHYLTHVKTIDEEVETEIKELDKYFNSERMWRYMDERWSHKDDYYNNPKTMLTDVLDREVRDWKLGIENSD